MAEKKVVCFHHDDLDGEASAAIVRMHNGADCVAVGYKDPFPFERITADVGEVWIVDFSLGQDEGGWPKLLAKCEGHFYEGLPEIPITWIDHHGSAIKRAEKIPAVMELPGVREEGNKAACELTWEYIYPRNECPFGITLIGDYDAWRFDGGELTRNYKAGVEAMKDTRPEEGYDGFWSFVLARLPNEISRIEMVGREIRKKRAITDAARVEKWAFAVAFWAGEMRVSGVAMNTDRRGSDQFESVAGEYQLLLPYVYDGRQWTVGVYRGGNGEHIDCAMIAESFGGVPWEEV
jgi:hypothetical protein